MTVQTIAPVVKTLSVACSASQAFRVFTEEIAGWWPTATHSVAAMANARPGAVTLEPRIGGRLYETGADGGEIDWGRVIAYEPPVAIALDWNPSREERPYTRVEVRFSSDGAHRCTVELVHSGWEVLDGGAASRDSYDGGWNVVLEVFVAAAERA